MANQFDKILVGYPIMTASGPELLGLDNEFTGLDDSIKRNESAHEGLNWNHIGHAVLEVQNSALPAKPPDCGRAVIEPLYHVGSGDRDPAQGAHVLRRELLEATLADLVSGSLAPGKPILSDCGGEFNHGILSSFVTASPK